MNWKAAILYLAVALTAMPSAADAQRRRRPAPHPNLPQGPAHKIEVIGFGGYAWAVGRDFYSPNTRSVDSD